MLLTDLLLEDQKKLETPLIAMVYQYPTYAAQVYHWLEPSMLVTDRYRKFWRDVKQHVTPNMSEYDAKREVSKAWIGAGLSMNGDFHNAINTPDIDLESVGNRLREIRYLLDAEEHTRQVMKGILARDPSQVRTAIEGFQPYRNAESASMPTIDRVGVAFIEAVKGGSLSIDPGIPKVKRAIGGFGLRELTVIAGRPSMGKTALGLQFARNAAAQGKRVGFFSLEMSQEALFARMACPPVGLVWKDVLAGDITDQLKENLEKETNRLVEQYRGTLYIDDSTWQTVDGIYEKVIKQELDIIFIDHLRLMRDRPDLKETQRLGVISLGLKNLAKSLNVASVSLAQLNRGVEGRDKKRPQLSDLRESGEIEENADTVLMIYRDEYYTDGADTGGLTELWVRKFRNGLRNSKIELAFDIEKEWFDEPQKPTAPMMDRWHK